MGAQVRYHHKPEPRNWDEFYASTKEHFEGYWDELCGRPDRHRLPAWVDDTALIEADRKDWKVIE